MSFIELISENFKSSSEYILRSLERCQDDLNNAIEESIRIYENGGVLFFAGNGGSAADACHIASELVGSFEEFTSPLPAISFATDVAILTSVSNDFSFDDIFVQQAKAFARKGDMIWLISTSGNSANIIKTAEWAKGAGVVTVGLLGKSGGRVSELVDFSIVIPGENTQRIQEVHILVLHTLASALRRRFRDGSPT